MAKFIASISALAFILSLAVAPQPSSAAPMGMDHRRCPRGSHWVPTHRDRRGHWVRAHCSPR
jgi:hypothetical protein